MSRAAADSRRSDRGRAARHQPRRATTPARAARRRRRSASATSRASRRRKGCTRSPRPTSRFRARTGTRRCRLEAAGYLARDREPLSRRASSAALETRRARRRVHLSRRGRSRRQARVPAHARRAVGAGDLRRAEGHVPPRGDGDRRAGRAAAARRVHRRSSRRPAAGCWSTPDDPEALADGLYSTLERSPRCARRSASARFDGRARSTTRSPGPPTACSRCTTSADRAQPSSRAPHP